MCIVVWILKTILQRKTQSATHFAYTDGAGRKIESAAERSQPAQARPRRGAGVAEGRRGGGEQSQRRAAVVEGSSRGGEQPQRGAADGEEQSRLGASGGGGQPWWGPRSGERKTAVGKKIGSAVGEDKFWVRNPSTVRHLKL